MVKHRKRRRHKACGPPLSAAHAANLGSCKINFSVVFAGQLVGIRQVADQVWQVSFLSYDLGYFEKDEGRVQPVPIPSCRTDC